MASTYEPIATSDISNVTSVTFSSIPSTYTDIRIVVVQTHGVEMLFNNDSTASYSQTGITGSGTVASSSSLTSRSSMYPQESNQSQQSNVIIDIFSYAGSNYKISLASASVDNNGSGTVERKVMLWRNNTAINSVLLRTGTASVFGTGSVATIYGIKAA